MGAVDDAWAALQGGSGGTGPSGGVGKARSGTSQGIGDRSPVFVGYQNSIEPGLDAHDRRSGAHKVSLEPKSAIEVKNEFYSLSDHDRTALGLSLYKSGLVNDPTAFDQVQAAWNKAVDDAAGFYQGGKGRAITPWEVLSLKMGVNGQKAGGPKTQTSTSFNIPSPQDAEAGIKAIFSSAVGRDPTGDELKKYTAIMVGLAKKNPSTSTTTYDASGNATTTSGGGISGEGLKQAALDQVQKDPEWGAFQAATTYFNAVQQAIAAPA